MGWRFLFVGGWVLRGGVLFCFRYEGIFFGRVIFLYRFFGYFGGNFGGFFFGFGFEC